MKFLHHSLKMGPSWLVADRNESIIKLTEALTGFAVTPAVLPRLLLSWAVLVRRVFISNLVEEVDLVLVREQGSPDAVDRCITPPLTNCVSEEFLRAGGNEMAHTS